MGWRTRSIALAATLGLAASALVATAPGAAAFTACPLVAADGTVTPGPAFFADWSGCDLSGANLSNTSLYAMDISGANLTGANLTGLTDFRGRAAGANFTNARLGGANLQGALFSGANFTGADLSTATITGAYFTGAVLAGARSQGLIGTPADLPAGWSIIATRFAGPGAMLASVRLSQQNLPGLDLRGANLTGATILQTTLDRANLSGARLVGMLADASSFRGANLRGANLTGANFVETVDFTGANLTGATLTGAREGFASFTGLAIWTGARCADGQLSSRHVDGSCLKALARVPGAPRTVRVGLPGTRGRAFVTWLAPTTDGGRPVTGYEYCLLRCDRASQWKTAWADGVRGRLAGLARGPWTVKVRARNIMGVGPSTSASWRQP